jgi:hypothetical protein
MNKPNAFYRIIGKYNRVLFRLVNNSHYLTINKLGKINQHLRAKQHRLVLTVRSEVSFKTNRQSELDEVFQEKFAIVFQGKFPYENQQKEFINNVKSFRNAYPKVKIIVSTYEGEINDETFLKSLGVDVIHCQDVGALESPFSPNLSRQIETTFTGLSLAKTLGKEFAVKIRMDQYISPVNFIEICSAMLNTFPTRAQSSFSSYSTKERLFVSSFNTFRRKPLHISDMLMFGQIDSLVAYWRRCPSWEFIAETRKLEIKNPNISFHNLNVPEVWLATRYLDFLGYQFSDLMMANDHAWRNEFGVIDSAWIGQNWSKYIDFLNSNLATNTWFFKDYFSNNIEDSSELTFKDWWVQYYL